MNTFLTSLRSKIACCFADSVYTDYEQTRYGINNCKEVLEDNDLNRYEDYLYILNVLLLDYCDNNTLEQYKEQNIFVSIYKDINALQFKDKTNRFFRNPIYGKLDCEHCNINKIINLINSL